MTNRLLGIVKWHATPLINRWEVARRGILTSEDHRKKGRIWLGDIEEMVYVMDHLTAVRNLTSMSFAVFAVQCHLLDERPKNCGRKGIYYLTRDVPPHACSLEYVHWCVLDRDDYC